MLEYSVIHWTTFLTAATLLNLSPGPDFAYILAQTARGGRKAGFAAMSGIWTGALGHVLMATVGLSAVLAASALAFSAVKWLGAAYLIWLGLSAFRRAGRQAETATSGASGNRGRIWLQGTLIALLNPKVAIFFLAFLPQFVVPGAGPVWLQLLLHGSLVVAISALIEPVLVLSGERIVASIRGLPRTGLWADRGLGAVFIAIGIRLALQER